MSSPPPARKRGRPVNTQAEYRLLAERLRERIVSGEWRYPMALPSIRELAREHGVGKDVARKALDLLRDEGRISVSGHRRHVVAYRRKRAIPTMSAADSVLLVIPVPLNKAFRGGFGTEMFDGIREAAGLTDTPLILAHSYQFTHALPHGFLDTPLRGIVLLGNFAQVILERYARLSVPAVLTDIPSPHPKLRNVCPDHRQAAHEAVRRLIALGHRRIAFLRFVSLGVREVPLTARVRQEGYFAAMEEAGLPVRKNWVYNTFSRDTHEKGAYRAFFEAKAGFTAALCTNLEQVEHLSMAAKQRGLRIPDDFSVACFASTTANPEISGPRINFQEMGRRALRLVLEDHPEPHQVRLPAGWHEGAWVAPVPALRKQA